MSSKAGSASRTISEAKSTNSSHANELFLMSPSLSANVETAEAPIDPTDRLGRLEGQDLRENTLDRSKQGPHPIPAPVSQGSPCPGRIADHAPVLRPGVPRLNASMNTYVQQTINVSTLRRVAWAAGAAEWPGSWRADGLRRGHGRWRSPRDWSCARPG